MNSSTAPAGWSKPVALVVAAAFFIEQVDSTILTTALPAIADDFGLRPAEAGIVMTAYLLAVAVFIPLSGWLADRLLPRRVFIAAIVLFTLASLVCGLSQSIEMLVCGRVLQGIAGSMMVPVGRLIVLRPISKSQLVYAVAFLTWPALTAPIIAPFLGGVISQYAGWPWIFFINVPLGVVLTLFAWRIIPRAETVELRRFDYGGLLLVSGVIVALMVGLELIAVAETMMVAVGLLMATTIGAVLTVRWSRRVDMPLLELGAYRYQTFRVSNSSGVLYRVAVSSAPFLLPLLLQDGLGWSPVLAGLMLMWVFAGNIGVKPFTTALLRRFGFATMIAGASIGLALTFFACVFITDETPTPVVAVVFFFSGVFRSIGFTGYGTLQFADVPSGEMNGANTLSSTLVQFATGLGVALAAVVVRFIDLGTRTIRFDSPTVAYQGTLVLMAVLALGSIIGILRLPPGAAEEVRGPMRPRK